MNMQGYQCCVVSLSDLLVNLNPLKVCKYIAGTILRQQEGADHSTGIKQNYLFFPD